MRYADEVHQYIADNVKGTRVNKLTDMVNEKYNVGFTNSKMRSYMKNHSLKNGLPTRTKGEGANIYPKEIRSFIYENYIGVGHKDMADLLNKTFNTNYTKEQIKGCYSRFKLDSGLTGQYLKGSIPFNKGKKKYWVGGEETQFKKGNMPINHREVGSERISVDGYTEIKVSEPNKWRMKHVVVWEEVNGKVKKGNCIIFGDGNKLNLDIDNLIKISRRQLVIINHLGLIQRDVELTKIGIAIADVKIKIGERTKKRKG